MKFEAVLFDLDGTLTDTLEDLKNSVNYALLKFGFPERSTEEIRSFVGNGVKRLVFRSVPEGTDENLALQCLEAFKLHYKNNSLVETKPYNGVIDLLKELKNNGVKTAVITNKMDSAAQDVVRFFFGGLVDFALGQLDGIAQKPEPDGIYIALEKLGVSKEKAVYIGDSEVDCLTAVNAGMPCIGVSWGFRSPDVLKANGADYIVNNPREILGICEIR